VAENIEEAIDRLYADAPEGFTAARDALAKELKAAGDDEAAKRVRSLRKPIRTAWAINRLVRDDANAVQHLLAAGERLRAAQQRALSGGGADELRERSEERRRLVNGLTERAARYLGEGEAPAAAVEDIAATLEAASIEQEAGAAVVEGRLVKPLPRPAGFGDVAGLKPIPGGKSREEPRRTPTQERAERRRHERELRDAEERERTVRARVDELRAELERLGSRTAAAREELRAAEAEARGAAVEVRRLQRSG
jgi:hypothetical protein